MALNKDEIFGSLVDDIFASVASGLKAKAEFMSRFEENPMNAFEWSNDVFAKMAELEHNQQILDLLKKSVSLEDIIQTLQDNVDRHALYPHFSTSPTSNLVAVYRARASARLIERLVSTVERMAKVA